MRGDRDNQGWHFKETVRLMKVMLKAGKACLVQQEREICVKLMERSAVLTEQLGKAVEPAGADEEDKEIAKRLHAEYFVLRTTLAWKQSRLDIAEHMFSKANIANDTLDPTSGEELADSLFEMGKDLLSGRQFELAARWLERALDVLDGIELEQLSQDASDLRLSIVHSYTKALLGLQTADARSKARDMMRLLETDYSEKMIVSLLKLDIILSEENVDAEQYYSVIHRIVLTVMLTANNIKTLMHHIHRLKNIQPDLAVKALDELLDLRLLKDSDKDEWVQKALVTRIWISTSKDNDKTGLRSLHELFDSIFHALRQPANVSATHAVQTLLWKRIESAFAAGHFETCESWCKLAVHQLLEKCGEINKSKIVRKLILCAIQQHEFNKARELFFQVSDSAKAAPITRYLMYKVSLRIEDMEFAAENLEAICKASSKDATFLYACVMEAQQVGNKKQTAQALQKVLGKYEHGAPPGVHLPALLRSMARLLTGELSAGSTPADQSMEELCKVFEGAIAAACKEGAKNGSATHKNVFNMTELEWFSRSSYNLALKGCAQISPQFLVRLIRACQRLIDILLERQPEADTDRAKLGLRAMFCSWLSACAHIVIARTEDNIEASLQSYLAVRSCGVSFRSRLPVQLMEETVAEPAQEDLKDKHFQLIKFELEAALKLLRWEDMDELFEV